MAESPNSDQQGLWVAVVTLLISAGGLLGKNGLGAKMLTLWQNRANRAAEARQAEVAYLRGRIEKLEARDEDKQRQLTDCHEKHRDCEVKTARLETEVNGLREDMERLSRQMEARGTNARTRRGDA